MAALAHLRASTTIVSTFSSNEFDAKDAYIARLLTPSHFAKPTRPINNASPPASKQPSAVTPPVIWGRNIESNWVASLFSLGMVSLAPCLVFFFWIALEWFEGSLLNTGLSFLSNNKLEWAALYLPRFELPVFVAYVAWFIFQAVLYSCLPGPVGTGQLTPAGHQLQ